MDLKRRAVTLVLAAAALIFAALPAAAAYDAEKTAYSVVKSVPAPQVGSIGGEWAVIGLARLGADVPEGYFDDYYSRVESYVSDCGGVLHARKYTEYSRVSLALTAIGRDPRNVAGYDLLRPLGDFEKTIWQGINGPIWALIALDAGGYEIPAAPEAKTQATRELYVGEILKKQLADGGWSLTGAGDGDADLTAMALQALAKYRDEPQVESVVQRALDFLSRSQLQSGGYSSWGSENCESSAQVLVALCELGIPVGDERFVKNGKTVLDALLSFRRADGGFDHVHGGSDGNNEMSTEQALYALADISRVEDGKSSLYRMTDEKAPETSEEKAEQPAAAALSPETCFIGAVGSALFLLAGMARAVG